VQGQVYTDKQLTELENQMGVKMSDTQKKAYTTLGGTPFLDGDYTVFGEVIEGLEVIDKIAAQTTDYSDRPKEDISMTIKECK
ncbi:MAG: peptidylprolyl isomerase, partial [Bacteroidales bacterium]